MPWGYSSAAILLRLRIPSYPLPPSVPLSCRCCVVVVSLSLVVCRIWNACSNVLMSREESEFIDTGTPHVSLYPAGGCYISTSASTHPCVVRYPRCRISTSASTHPCIVRYPCIFPAGLFQTTPAVRRFHEKLGACVVENRIVNSFAARWGQRRGPDFAERPFRDGVVMRYPKSAHWPEGEIDLLGPGY